jgi:hypothetical protein
MPGRDLDVTEVDAGVQHGGDEGVAQQMWVQVRHPHPCGGGQGVQAAGGGMPVHPSAVGVEQDRAGQAVTDGGVDGPSDCGWERDEDGLVALAVDLQDPVAVLLAGRR